jgi:integrase
MPRRTKSAENIWKLPSGRYLVRWRNPAGRECSMTFPSFEQARSHRDEVSHSKRKGGYIDPDRGKTPLGGYWEKFVGRAHDLTPATRHLYVSAAERCILPHFGDWPLASISREDVGDWITSLQDRGIRPSGIEVAYRVLRRVLSDAVENGRLAVNPATGITLPKLAERERRFLSAEEVARIATAVDERYRALVLLLGLSGLRIGEALALRVGDIDFLRRTIKVTKAVTEVSGTLHTGKPKTKRSRAVPIPPIVADEIAAHLDRTGNRDLVFTSPHGLPIRRTTFRRLVWAPALNRAGIAPPLPRVHDLRHAAVALAIEMGAHPKQIQEMVGHANITMTLDQYGHLFPSAAEQLAGRMDATFRAAADRLRTETGKPVVALSTVGEGKAI